MEKRFWVYMLASGYNGVLYVGVTSDLIGRTYQHREEVIKGFTQKYKVHDLVYFEEHATAEQAFRREKCFKKWPRQWKINLIEQTNPDWHDLWSQITG